VNVVHTWTLICFQLLAFQNIPQGKYVDANLLVKAANKEGSITQGTPVDKVRGKDGVPSPYIMYERPEYHKRVSPASSPYYQGEFLHVICSCFISELVELLRVCSLYCLDFLEELFIYLLDVE